MENEIGFNYYYYCYFDCFIKQMANNVFQVLWFKKVLNLANYSGLCSSYLTNQNQYLKIFGVYT